MTAKIDSDSPSPSKAIIEASVETLREELTSDYGGLDRKELKQLESFVHKRKALPFIHPLVSLHHRGDRKINLYESFSYCQPFPPIL